MSVNAVGNLEAITANRIDGIETAGRLNGAITSTSIIGDIAASGGIRGNIVASGANATIGDIDAGSSDIGQVNTPVNIYAKSSIGRITCKDLYASIDCNTNTLGADGNISSMLVKQSFHGSLKTGTLGSDSTLALIQVDGDLDADKLVAMAVTDTSEE